LLPSGVGHVAETAVAERAELGPWNPGIRSQLPAAFLPLSTIFRPESVFTGLEDAYERSAFTGLEPEDHVAFRPERLAVHETLIRVTADVSVPDGPNYEDLGINFREITRTILTRYVEPHMAEIVRAYDDLKDRVAGLLDEELKSSLFAPSGAMKPEPRRRTLLHSLGLAPHRARARAPSEGADDRERSVLARWREAAELGDDPLLRSAHRALLTLADAIRARHGRLRGDGGLLTALATDLICNEQGSEMIGRLIEPLIREAAKREGYRLLPSQERPVVMNVKGAPASGKSTMRPLQRRLAEELGIPWTDFAVISPDIWRKYLLDYESLGAARRYAGTLTGLELKIIDQKLDRYMTEKAEQGRMSHLLIDRFRFDSFAEEPDEEEGSRLLTRFGDLVYMFFMITPPDATVERAWKRGLQVGRYKAVDDLLAHNIEAFTGMPRLFFTWAAKTDKSVHYEFLDNSVPEGQRPRTVAFGWNREMNVLDIKCLLDVERYKSIDVQAKDPASVYPDAAAMAPERNTGFLAECARRMAAINFVDRETGLVYASMEAGKMRWADPAALTRAMADEETRAGLLALAHQSIENGDIATGEPKKLDSERIHTLGECAAGPRLSRKCGRSAAPGSRIHGQLP
jgi:hypothetical protein